MINRKRITLLSGHYGSGKTNIAVNLALARRQSASNVAIADLDIVNPYFRTKDSSEELRAAGIRLICSEYANSNVDIPALPQDIYAITDDRSLEVIVDIGGDDRGALALGRIVPGIIAEGNYEMLMVINCYRPLTPDAASTVEVMREIEAAGRLPFTGLVNNSNLGAETTAEHLLRSVRYAEEVAALAGIPVEATTARADIAAQLTGRIPDLVPLHIRPNFIENKII